MADKFNPRGAPVPSTGYYDDWELTNRPDMLPFLAEYTNTATGERSGGFAMPSMVEEPINALSRLFNTPSGTMPDPDDPQNRQDALLGLMSLYGGNALGGMARGAASRAAGHALEMEAARPVAYSNAIDEAMSNPNMLSMMRDIDYANLNRRALDEYGVGYEGLSSSQEAKLRGWSDPALLSDTGRPNPVGAGVASHLDMSPEARLARAREQGFDTNTTWYHGSFNDFDAFDPRTIGDNFAADDKGFFFSNVPSQASDYALSDTVGLPKDGGMVYPTHIKFERPLIVDESRLRREGMGGVLGKTEDPISFWDNYQGLLHEWATKEGADGITIVDNSYKVPHGPNKGQSSMMHVAFNPEDIRSVNAAFDPAKAGQNGLLLSDTGKPNPLGAALASQDPVAYSNAIDEAMSNPNMLSMMRDIDYANLNRRALDEYGVGYEGLTSSQEAKLRGWSDPGDVTFSSKNASIFDPPDKPQRAFEKDYKGAIPATHNWLLTHDIEGRPLTAKYVVGRQVAGESDVALSPAEYDAVTEALIGRGPAAFTQSELGKGNVGTYIVRPTEDGLVRSIGVLDTLSPDKAARVKAHEMGHMLEDLSGDFVRYENGVPVRVIPNDGILQKELKPLYNSLNNHNRQRPPGDDAASWAKPVTPDTFKYKNGEIPPEYMAEAIRAYLTNPNYIKTVAPKTAARIREYVNTNPRLKDIIQFNANASPLAGWLASGANALAQPEDP